MKAKKKINRRICNKQNSMCNDKKVHKHMSQ